MFKHTRNDPEHETPPIKASAKFVQKLCPNQAWDIAVWLMLAMSYTLDTLLCL